MYKWREPGGREAIVSYHDGIFMVGGLDKGEALIELLSRLGVSYEHVVLVDDGEKNIKAMQSALAKRNVAYHGLHYIRVNKPQPPTSEDIETAEASWREMRSFMGLTFPERLKAIERGECFY
jgi:hypothetical protein